MVKCIDDNVGKILDALRTHKLIDSTIVIFTADHGDMCGEHARDNKGVPYESSAKVPFVLYYPNKVKAGTVITRSLGCVDFLPTIISLMGFRTAGKEQGRDASELFTKADAAKGWKDITFLRGTGSGDSVNWLAAVTARYKLVFSPEDNPWLFDLEKDPDELTNFFEDPAYRRTVRFLAKDLVAYCRTYNDHYSSDPKIKSDLAWAAEGTGKYVPAVIAKKPRTNKKTRNTKERKTRRTKNKK
jgi:arylsulfatase A-like enzyme